ncbi:MAG: energy-coupled thiamine transporter ThiT [Acholeplasmataceae bacterium]
MGNKKVLRKLVLTAILLAIAVVFDIISSQIPGLNLSMPFGGKFFGISMIPLILIGLTCGLEFGLIAGFLFGVYNFSFDYMIYLSALRDTLETWTGTSWNSYQILLLVLFDYVLPFMAFGLSGLFKKQFSKFSSVVKSIILVSIIRLISSTLSGVVLWSSSIDYALSEVENGNADPNLATRIFSFVDGNIWLYSLSYNITYILTTGIVVYLILMLTHKRIYAIAEQNIL